MERLCFKKVLCWWRKRIQTYGVLFIIFLFHKKVCARKCWKWN